MQTQSILHFWFEAQNRVRSCLFPSKSMSIISAPTYNLDPAQAALAALSRAGLRAAEDARRTNTYMVLEENGKVLRESSEEYLCKRTESASRSNSKHSA
ncbi:hypothetical protein [Acidovorax sp. JG5]|uniref:hypothetical protein n=1 Tax=Acidovorax sp. JG5 TaxID=2822718 RepID=UPI001FF09B98|nr:hypothetical protein [Acidovorax sp. JG5]